MCDLYTTKYLKNEYLRKIAVILMITLYLITPSYSFIMIISHMTNKFIHNYPHGDSIAYVFFVSANLNLCMPINICVANNIIDI